MLQNGKLQEHQNRNSNVLLLYCKTKKCWLQMSNSAELQNIAMEICFSILKASWQRTYMFVNNIHRRGVWIEYGSHLYLQ